MNQQDKFEAGAGHIYFKLVELIASLSLVRWSNPELGKAPHRPWNPGFLLGEAGLQLPQLISAVCVCFLSPINAFLHLLTLSAVSETFPCCTCYTGVSLPLNFLIGRENTLIQGPRQ